MSRAGLAVVQQPVTSLKVTPGLSEYARQPENVGQSLGPLLEYAHKQVQLPTYASDRPKVGMTSVACFTHLLQISLGTAGCKGSCHCVTSRKARQQPCLQSGLQQLTITCFLHACQRAWQGFETVLSWSADSCTPAQSHRGAPFCNSRLQGAGPKACRRADQ